MNGVLIDFLEADNQKAWGKRDGDSVSHVEVVIHKLL